MTRRWRPLFITFFHPRCRPSSSHRLTSIIPHPIHRPPYSLPISVPFLDIVRSPPARRGGFVTRSRPPTHPNTPPHPPLPTHAPSSPLPSQPIHPKSIFTHFPRFSPPPRPSDRIPHPHPPPQAHSPPPPHPLPAPPRPPPLPSHHPTFFAFSPPFLFAPPLLRELYGPPRARIPLLPHPPHALPALPALVTPIRAPQLFVTFPLLLNCFRFIPLPLAVFCSLEYSPAYSPAV
ncbi:hypothetical protein DFH06DRAFT_1341286 [Mycena polygramma]|nr:hypothetical protein DFH06DRAFT_1341286 [Mycena polygramma]